MVRSELTLTQEGCVSRIHTLGHVSILPFEREGFAVDAGGEGILEAASRGDLELKQGDSVEQESRDSDRSHPSSHVKQGGNLHEKIVCAAISTVEQQFFYALKELLGVQPERHLDLETGEFHLQCRAQEMNTLSAEQMNVWKTLSRVLIIGIKMIEAAHGEAFSSKIIQSKTIGTRA